MTIPRKSRLADVADKVFSYPVKKKHQPRRLRPNLDAIRYLETESETDTEIESVRVLGDQEEWAQMTGVRALGWYRAKRAGHYPRRMFDVLALETSSSNMISYAKPCPACLDFSRTWACEEHPELPWDTEEHQFVRPEPAPPTASSFLDTLQRQYAEAMRLIEERTDPNRNQPGCHYSSIQDRWVPNALADFREGGEVGAGFFRGQPVTIDQVGRNDEMTAEWERQNHVPLAEALMQIDRVPSELMGPTRRDFSVTLSGTFTLEITGETAQSASSITVQIEVESDDR